MIKPLATVGFIHLFKPRHSLYLAGPALALTIAGIALWAGCAPWSKPSQRDAPSRLPSTRLSPDSVVLEVALAQLENDDQQRLEDLWQTLDTQSIDLDVRRRLDRNGLRCALAPTHLPSDLQAILTRRSSATEASLSWRTGLMQHKGIQHPGTILLHQRVQNQTGRPHWVVTTGPHDLISCVLYEGDRRKAMTFSRAQCGFSITTFPQGHGQVKIRIRPEILHGDRRQRLTVIDESLRFQEQQHVASFDSLDIETYLRPGQTLLISPTREVTDMGRTFLSSSDQESPQKRLLLVRLVHTQMDELFAPRTADRPLSTPVE